MRTHLERGVFVVWALTASYTNSFIVVAYRLSLSRTVTSATSGPWLCEETAKGEAKRSSNSLQELCRLIGASSVGASKSEGGLLCLSSECSNLYDDRSRRCQRLIRNSSDITREGKRVQKKNKDLDDEKFSATERGVILTSNVKRGEEILRVPLSSCLRDDDPPDWIFSKKCGDDQGDKGTGMNGGQDIMLDPTRWETRLAASFLEVKYLARMNGSGVSCDEDDRKNRGRERWLSMLPEPAMLRASLPVHWSEEALASARCCALELATDTAYFSRADAVSTMMDGLKKVIGGGDEAYLFGTRRDGNGSSDGKVFLSDFEAMERACHHALDIVQTRACRVETRSGFPLRILAPIFDFINHGGKRRANAAFLVEDEDACVYADDNGYDVMESPDDITSYSPGQKRQESLSALVVRASRDIAAGEEVLLDYGDSASPSWRCLSSYGFVPDSGNSGKGGVTDDDDEDEAAEVFMNGVRYEVTRSTVPFEMAEAAAVSMLAESGAGFIGTAAAADAALADNPLTGEVALRIAKRVSDAAFDLVVEHEDTAALGDTPSEVQAAALAASLRWCQHRVLLDCAVGLRDYAEQQLKGTA